MKNTVFEIKGYKGRENIIFKYVILNIIKNIVLYYITLYSNDMIGFSAYNEIVRDMGNVVR